jgi:hypothetical protein
VSSARPAKSEHRRAVGPRPTASVGVAVLLPTFLWRSKEQVGRLSGRHPDAASRSEQDQRQTERASIAQPEQGGVITS